MTNENNNTNTTKPSVGIKAWGTVPAPVFKTFTPREDDLPRLPYMKFKPGLVSIRIISSLGEYQAARVKLPKSKGQFGDIIRSAYPLYPDCPLVTEAKVETKPRYTVLVIDRTDSLIKVFDMSPTQYGKIEDARISKQTKQSKKSPDIFVTPLDFDLDVKYDPTAPGMNQYNILPQDYENGLSEEDKQLIIDQLGSLDMVEKYLEKQLIVPKPATVRKKMESLGWTGEPIIKAKKENENADAKATLKAPEDDDYSFVKPEGEETETAAE